MAEWCIRYETIWQELLRATPCKGHLKSISSFFDGIEEIVFENGKARRQLTKVNRDVEKWEPWLCYKLTYILDLIESPSNYDWVKKNGNLGYQQSFFRFQRMFFTRLQASLDKSILTYLIGKAEGKIEEEIKGLAEDVEDEVKE